MYLNIESDLVNAANLYCYSNHLLAVSSLEYPGLMIDGVTVANFLGFVALIAYILTLLPSILRVVFPRTKKTELAKDLFKYRRRIGIISFLFTLPHSILLIEKRNFDFFDLQTYFEYYTGIFSFIIFTVLTITSNNWSVKKLGVKNWKKLHQLTYPAILLLLIHIWDKMLGDWSYITPIGIIAMIFIGLLFVTRKWIEAKANR